MDNRACFCRNPRCVLHGQAVPLARLKRRNWHRHAERFECEACGKLVSARAGTA